MATYNSVQEYIEQISLLQTEMHDLIVSEGGSKPANSLEQYMQALITTRETFVEFLNANGVTASLSEKISPAWIDKFKIALTNFIKGGSAMDIYNDKLTVLDNGYFSMKEMRSLTCPNVTTIYESACCGSVYFRTETDIGVSGDGLSLEEIHFANCISITTTRNIIVNQTDYQTLGAFAYRNKLKVVDMPKLEEIYTAAFYKCTSLENINLPSLKTLGSNNLIYGAFANCTKLQTAIFPELTTLQGTGIFYNCKALTSFEAPKLKTLTNRNDMFANCTNLANINLGAIKTITGSIFRNCINLVSVIAPKVTNIGTAAFYGCKSLPSIDFPNCTTINSSGAFQNCDALTNVNLPLCESIGSKTFYDCDLLVEISLPSLLVVASQSIANCVRLEKVFLANCNKIDTSAFYQDGSLTDVYLGYDGVVSLANVNAFGSTTADNPVTFHVKPDYADSYATATNWSSLIAQGKIIIVGDYSD